MELYTYTYTLDRCTTAGVSLFLLKLIGFQKKEEEKRKKGVKELYYIIGYNVIKSASPSSSPPRLHHYHWRSRKVFYAWNEFVSYFPSQLIYQCLLDIQYTYKIYNIYIVYTAFSSWQESFPFGFSFSCSLSILYFLYFTKTLCPRNMQRFSSKEKEKRSTA